MAEGWQGWDDYAPFYDWENAQTQARRDVEAVGGGHHHRLSVEIEVAQEKDREALGVVHGEL